MTDKNAGRKNQQRVVSTRVLNAESNTSSRRRGGALVVLLPYRRPFNWEAVLSFFRAHQVPHLEAVNKASYERVLKTAIGIGWLSVTHEPQKSSVRLSLWNANKGDVDSAARNVRRMFDLDADPDTIGKAMANDNYLRAIWSRYPGLRVARAWNGFESMLTTILGQVVSVSFGRTLTDELMQAAGKKVRHPKTGETIHLFPTAKNLLSADLTSVRTSEARRIAIRTLAQLVVDGALKWTHPIPPKELRNTLHAIPGVGAWTSEYVAMRGFHDDDAFPGTDYGLKQELKRHPEVDVNRVRPWRSYAATALWKSFAEKKEARYESVL